MQRSAIAWGARGHALDEAIGVRCRRSASRRDVGRRLGIGILVGGFAGVFLGRGIRAVLFRVEPVDLSVYAVVLATVATLGLIAALLPALRAARAQPAQSLGQ